MGVIAFAVACAVDWGAWHLNAIHTENFYGPYLCNSDPNARIVLGAAHAPSPNQPWQRSCKIDTVDFYRTEL